MEKKEKAVSEQPVEKKDDKAKIKLSDPKIIIGTIAIIIIAAGISFWYFSKPALNQAQVDSKSAEDKKADQVKIIPFRESYSNNDLEYKIDSVEWSMEAGERLRLRATVEIKNSGAKEVDYPVRYTFGRNPAQFQTSEISQDVMSKVLLSPGKTTRVELDTDNFTLQQNDTPTSPSSGVCLYSTEKSYIAVPLVESIRFEVPIHTYRAQRDTPPKLTISKDGVNYTLTATEQAGEYFMGGSGIYSNISLVLKNDLEATEKIKIDDIITDGQNGTTQESNRCFILGPGKSATYSLEFPKQRLYDKDLEKFTTVDIYWQDKLVSSQPFNS